MRGYLTTLACYLAVVAGFIFGAFMGHGDAVPKGYTGCARAADRSEPIYIVDGISQGRSPSCESILEAGSYGNMCAGSSSGVSAGVPLCGLFSWSDPADDPRLLRAWKIAHDGGRR